MEEDGTEGDPMAQSLLFQSLIRDDENFQCFRQMDALKMKR